MDLYADLVFEIGGGHSGAPCRAGSKVALLPQGPAQAVVLTGMLLERLVLPVQHLSCSR